MPEDRPTDRVAPRQVSRSAFTLIELLLVMGIMVILVAMVAGVSNYAMGKAMVSRTRATISVLALGLADLKATYGDYPETLGRWTIGEKEMPARVTVGVDLDIRNLYYWLTERAALKEPLDSSYLTRNGLNDATVLDAWKHPIVYRYPRVKKDGHFDLWSMGPDGLDSRASWGADIEPTDDGSQQNRDNIVWGEFERR